MEPKALESPKDREMARRIRNRQWAMLERIAERDPLWVCWWDKWGQHSQIEERPDDLEVFCLLSSNERFQWFGPGGPHADWIEVGPWSEERCAAPVRITAAGRSALAARDQYDMEPVSWGMVEPGWVCIPKREARVRAGALSGTSGLGGPA